MKKYFILTSVLALAACNDGPGGSVHNSEIHLSSDAIISNKNVTSMASEILIATDGISPNIIRSSSVTNAGKEYIAYHLDDAKFFGSDMETDKYISFGIDGKGQIDSILYHYGDGTIESIDRDNPEGSIFTENIYKYKVEFNNNTYYTDSLPIIEGGYSKKQIKQAFRDAYDGELSDEILANIDEIIDSTNMVPTEYVHHHVVDLQGKNLPDSYKLRYSDFGYTTILAKEIHQPGDGEGDDNSVVFGGYEIKEINDVGDFRSLDFSGKAIAALGGIHQNGVKKIETDDVSATLHIDADGNQTLTMPFNDYYTIRVERTQNGDEISWTGTTNINENGENFALDETKPVNNQHVSMKYYGDNATPSEVVGGIKFTNDGFTPHGVEFNGAFGLKK